MCVRGILTFIAFKKSKPHSLTFSTIFFIFITALSFAMPRFVNCQGPPDWVADELLVGLRPGVAKAKAQTVYHAYGAAIIDEIPQINTHLIKVPPHALEKVEQALLHRPEVEFVEQNRAFAPDFTPNDPYYANQWHLPQVKSPQAWDITQGAADIIIAILDSGVDETHNDLSGKVLAGYNFYDNNTDTADVYGHGTRVAGAAAATGDNGIGIAGVAWEARIMPIRVTNTEGWAYTFTISKGLAWAADNGARVMNLSFAGVTGSSSIRSAAQYVADRGGVVVAAAGNCGCDDSVPEATYIVSVSATDRNDNLAYFSSRGEYVDVSAPGVGIWTTSRGGGYASVSGTSFSSPVTAGVVALIMSANPELAPLEVVEILENTADDLGQAGYDPSFGFGRVNAYEAILAAAGSDPRPDTTPPSVAISSPAAGSKVFDTVGVSVQASDDVGTATVELYLDGNFLAADTAEPFTFAWDTTKLEDGSHALQAVAFDAAGNAGDSDVVVVTVDNTMADTTAPEVSIVSPASEELVSGTFSVNVSASDDNGVTAVELYLDGNFLAADTAEPFTFAWDTTRSTAGTHTLMARAYDAAGNFASSAEVTVTVENALPDLVVPSVTITSPEDGSTVSKVVRIIVTAEDDTELKQVDVLVDGDLIKSAACDSNVCEVQSVWNTKKVSTGSHTVSALARDASGNVGSSNAVNVVVK